MRNDGNCCADGYCFLPIHIEMITLDVYTNYLAFA